jgi:glycosyltransferase involved in cell wall biosynthesis
MAPLISVVMPVLDAERTLASAIQSILHQTCANWEMLIIDDGSSDYTVRIAESFTDHRVKILADGSHKGLSARLNEGIYQCRGKYLARMDSDDIAYPQRLEQQVQYLEQHPRVDLVGAEVIVFGQGGVPLGKHAAPESHSIICAKPFAGFPMAHPTYIGKLEWFRQYLYRDDAIKCEDQDLLVRSYRSSQFANVTKILLGYREEKINLKKILVTRRFLARRLLCEFRQQRRPGLALRAFAEQVLKGAVDFAAISTGLNYRLLRHRARPISQTDRQAWEQVWKMVNQPEN